VWKLAFAWLFYAVNVDVFETLLLDVAESMVIG
jgi:hypothetical protein